MTRLDRLGLTLLASGIGLAFANVVTWAIGFGVSGWRPPLSGVLMVGGLVVLAVGIVQGLRADAEE